MHTLDGIQVCNPTVAAKHTQLTKSVLSRKKFHTSMWSWQLVNAHCRPVSWPQAWWLCLSCQIEASELGYETDWMKPHTCSVMVTVVFVWYTLECGYGCHEKVVVAASGGWMVCMVKCSLDLSFLVPQLMRNSIHFRWRELEKLQVIYALSDC
jgi:hypothetical protein